MQYLSWLNLRHAYNAPPVVDHPRDAGRHGGRTIRQLPSAVANDSTGLNLGSISSTVAGDEGPGQRHPEVPFRRATAPGPRDAVRGCSTMGRETTHSKGMRQCLFLLRFGSF